MKIGEEQQYLTVSVLNKYIKRKFDYDPHLETVFVKGEISNSSSIPVDIFILL